MSTLETQSAIIMKGPGQAQVEHDLAIPSPGPSELLIHTRAVALNPSDWMALDTFARPGAGAGYDFAGEVVEIGEIGENVKTHWMVGDRVAGFVHGCHAANYTTGAFRQYIIADAELVIRIPEQLQFDAASTLGMGISTAAQALYQSLKLPLPTEVPKPIDQTILIYGGSTATGSIAIQLAKLSGLRVITTCSPSNVSWMQALGADEIVDYKSPNAVKQVIEYVHEHGLWTILDCIGVSETANFCYQCFTPARDKTHQPDYIYASLMPILRPPPVNSTLLSSHLIQNRWKFVYTCFGKRFTTLMDNPAINGTWQPCVEDKNFMSSFYRRVETLLASEKIRLMPYEIQEGGLYEVLEGISLVRAGKAHGKKLVYPVL